MAYVIYVYSRGMRGAVVSLQTFKIYLSHLRATSQAIALPTIREWKKIRRVILIESQHRYYKKTHMPFPVGLALRVCKEVYWDALPMCVVPITLGTYWLSLKRNENDDLVHSSSTPRAIMAGLVVGYTFPVSFPVITAYKFIFPRDITMERFCMGDSWEQSVKTVDRKVN